jgi:hypothetical protein
MKMRASRASSPQAAARCVSSQIGNVREHPATPAGGPARPDTWSRMPRASPDLRRTRSPRNERLCPTTTCSRKPRSSRAAESKDQSWRSRGSLNDGAIATGLKLSASPRLRSGSESATRWSRPPGRQPTRNGGSRRSSTWKTTDASDSPPRIRSPWTKYQPTVPTQFVSAASRTQV